MSSQESVANGFTLAETLITLVIIGVVAALTVPTLIVKYQKEQTVTRLKKAYSALSQTTQKAIADHGPIETWEIGQNNAESAKLFFNKYLAPYLSLSVSAKTRTESNWLNDRTSLNGTPKNYDNGFIRAYLADGTSLTCWIQGEDDDKRLGIDIDINGDKKPNKFGRDIFEYYYYININHSLFHGKFLPTGLNNSRTRLLSSDQYMCNKNSSGHRCAALIMKDGWRISDDYPW